ncbi:hypothetical protein BDZ97DRAFT_1767620 [Flammula alnicola]|nr:hypothetical protein BDZ97DRAFT_1767620 [Flammula alnicola]
MSSSREPSPLPTLDAAIGIFDIYQFIRPALPALRDCLQDEINADSAYAALQSQVYFMSRFLCFADIVGSEYLIPDDIHAFRRLHADLAKLLSPDQLTALLCEDWIIDNPARKSLPLDYTFPPAPAGALLFTPQRQKLAEDFMRKQQQEHTRRVAAQKAREERARLAALREQAEREEAAQQAELQRQAAMSAHQTEVDQAPVGCLTIDLDSLIRFSEGDINAREATPPLPASSKAAGKRKRASSVRRSERQLAKSKAIVTGSGDEEDGPAGSAGPSKRAKYAPSRARTKILSQEDLLAKAQALWHECCCSDTTTTATWEEQQHDCRCSDTTPTRATKQGEGDGGEVARRPRHTWVTTRRDDKWVGRTSEDPAGSQRPSAAAIAQGEHPTARFSTDLFEQQASGADLGIPIWSHQLFPFWVASSR